jgi:hypothetical protein
MKMRMISSLALAIAATSPAFCQAQPAVKAPAAVAPVPVVPATAKPLAVADAVKVLVDGKAWNWSVPDGKTGRMTFTQDGKGKLEGPISMGISWRVKNSDFCIVMGMMLGTKCVSVVPVANGYQTFNKGKPGFLFTR